MDRDEFKERLANLADQRQNNLVYVERVISEFPQGHVLHGMANAMAIAMAYAQFEGFVKDSLQQYIEFVEVQEIPRAKAIPCLVAHSWGPAFKSLRADSSLTSRIKFARDRSAEMEEPLTFRRSEKEIDTRSNLKFNVLVELATMLGLDRSSLSPYKNKLNALVAKRNSVAHGSRSETVTELEVREALECVLGLFRVIETCLHAAVDDYAYLRRSEVSA